MKAAKFTKDLDAILKNSNELGTLYRMGSLKVKAEKTGKAQITLTHTESVYDPNRTLNSTSDFVRVDFFFHRLLSKMAEVHGFTFELKPMDSQYDMFRTFILTF